MQNRRPPELDMNPDGSFRTPPRPPLALRIGAVALVIAVLTGALAAAVLVFWFALALIPIAIVAALIAWVAFRIQLWRIRRSARGQRAVFRTF
jgi:4-hydroxybenzoate polyprenyltransferase